MKNEKGIRYIYFTKNMIRNYIFFKLTALIYDLMFLIKNIDNKKKCKYLYSMLVLEKRLILQNKVEYYLNINKFIKRNTHHIIF